MLRTPEFPGAFDPVMQWSAQGDDFDPSIPAIPEEIEPGVVLLDHHKLETLVRTDDWSWDQAYPDLVINSYGVCDSPAQFLERYRAMLESDDRTFVVGFTHVPKRPGAGGWRWHKWGPYIGDGRPTREYLADESGFDDGVYCYHIVQTSKPTMRPERAAYLAEQATDEP